jgi:hypothetical protein
VELGLHTHTYIYIYMYIYMFMWGLYSQDVWPRLRGKFTRSRTVPIICRYHSLCTKMQLNCSTHSFGSIP